ncbi:MULTISPECIES: hypothetical protein [Mycolicibacterium]|uniref:hypothetical protein n=1 Tax=Mycolicibacterium TaxID=1866885 RepID=UPI000FB5A373|nr:MULTISPECIES: hypothetical protein [Mycolicibacterium]RUP29033.1 MAG: hypothetical protein EKK51_21535 [Mycolicibacterium sp.]UCZ58784.1 hypothetical protein LHJ73_18630 [Mycolicibacterium phocaicum]
MMPMKPRPRFHNTRYRRVLAIFSIVALMLSALIATTRDEHGSTIAALPGAAAQPSVPGGGSGGSGDNGGGPPFPMQPPAMPDAPGSYNGGSYPAPYPGNGIDINNPAEQSGQAPQQQANSQQNNSQQLQPANGQQPPDYDAPPQQQAQPNRQAPQSGSPPTPQTQPNDNQPREQPQQQNRRSERIQKASCFESGDLNPFDSCDDANKKTDLYQKMTSCLGDRPGDVVSAANAVDYGGEIERWTLTNTRTLEKTQIAYKVLCTQASFIHLAEDHDPRSDPTNWFVCVSAVLNANIEEAASNPTLGSFQYDYGRGTAVVVFDPVTKVIVTTYTKGPRNDWGGCARGALAT